MTFKKFLSIFFLFLNLSVFASEQPKNVSKNSLEFRNLSKEFKLPKSVQSIFWKSYKDIIVNLGSGFVELNIETGEQNNVETDNNIAKNKKQKQSLSPDKKLKALIKDRFLLISDNKSNKKTFMELSGHTDTINCIEWQPQTTKTLGGKIIATGSKDKTVRIWFPNLFKNLPLEQTKLLKYLHKYYKKNGEKPRDITKPHRRDRIESLKALSQDQVFALNILSWIKAPRYELQLTSRLQLCLEKEDIKTAENLLKGLDSALIDGLNNHVIPYKPAYDRMKKLIEKHYRYLHFYSSEKKQGNGKLLNINIINGKLLNINIINNLKNYDQEKFFIPLPKKQILVIDNKKEAYKKVKMPFLGFPDELYIEINYISSAEVEKIIKLLKKPIKEFNIWASKINKASSYSINDIRNK